MVIPEGANGEDRHGLIIPLSKDLITTFHKGAVHGDMSSGVLDYIHPTALRGTAPQCMSWSGGNLPVVYGSEELPMGSATSPDSGPLNVLSGTEGMGKGIEDHQGELISLVVGDNPPMARPPKPKRTKLDNHKDYMQGTSVSPEAPSFKQVPEGMQKHWNRAPD